MASDHAAPTSAPVLDRVRRRVLLVGWDSADLRHVDEVAAAGMMPCLSGLIARGAIGELAAIGSAIGPIAWTTIATGVRGDRHGILSDVEPDPISGDARPVSCRSREVKALWNLASQAGLRSIVVNWAASHPAEPIRGVCVDERFPLPDGPLGDAWPVAEGSVHPPELAPRLSPCRMHPAEFRREDLQAFVPSLPEIELAVDPRPIVVAGAVARTVGVHAAATELLEREAWDFAAIRYPLLGDLAPVFLKCRPPQLDGVPESDVERYGRVVDVACGLLDGMLARLLELAGPETMVVLVSERGLHVGEARKAVLARGSDPLAFVRPFGLVLVAGPGARADGLVHGATGLDVAPTVLSLLGLAAGADMRGRLLREAFSDAPGAAPVERRIPSWETVPGDDGRHPPLEATPWQEHEAIRQLASLGYVESNPVEAARADAMAARADVRRALMHLESLEWIPAIEALRRAHARVPDDRFARMLLATSLVMTGDADELAESRAHADAIADAPAFAPAASMIRGLAAAREGRADEALAHLAECERNVAPNAFLLDRLAWAYQHVGRPDDARRVLDRSREVDPDGCYAPFALAGIHLAQHRPEEAASEALRAIGRRYRWPQAHALLGVALLQLGREDEARRAFEISISQAPSATAHEGLAMLLSWDVALARHHREQAAALRNEGRT